MLSSTTKSQISFEAFFTELYPEWIIVGASSPFEFCSLYAWQSITDLTVLTKKHQIGFLPGLERRWQKKKKVRRKKHSYNTRLDSNFIFLDREYLLKQGSRAWNFLDQRFGKSCPSILNVCLTMPLRKNGSVLLSKAMDSLDFYRGSIDIAKVPFEERV